MLRLLQVEVLVQLLLVLLVPLLGRRWLGRGLLDGAVRGDLLPALKDQLKVLLLLLLVHVEGALCHHPALVRVVLQQPLREEPGGLQLPRGGLVLAKHGQALPQDGLQLLLDVLPKVGLVHEAGKGDVRKVEQDFPPGGQGGVRPVAGVLRVVRAIDRSQARRLDLPSFRRVGGAHEGAPRRDGADLRQAQGVNWAASHEAYELWKELLSLVLGVKILGLSLGQLFGLFDVESGEVEFGVSAKRVRR